MMTVVSPINPQVRQVEAPAALRELPGWLIWRYETFAGESKPRKVPYYVDGVRRHGRQGGAEDRTVWCWGLGSFGRLGTGSTANSVVPLEVGGL